MAETILGIDLGTTNSSVGAFVDGRLCLLTVEGPPQAVPLREVAGRLDQLLLPSVVGVDAAGKLLVGTEAANQWVAYPERTVRSVKRRMGSEEILSLGGLSLRPQEVSAAILRHLRERAERVLGRAVSKAVITVPAYFSDAQRKATREAGEIAGLTVLRLLNEPTAAALAYEPAEGDERRRVLVYDLGGGTFDVSVVTAEAGVTEVLASHGDNRLGGDDFDRLLVDELASPLGRELARPLADDLAAWHRLTLAAERAKRELSVEPFVRVAEEHLARSRAGAPLHLDCEVSRERFEELVGHLIERTLTSVDRALGDAGLRIDELDAVLLVGGSTRMPCVAGALAERTGVRPRTDMHPDLAVAVGATVLGGRLGGEAIDEVLVDITPYSFGTSYLDDDSFPARLAYKVLIPRGSPLPVRRAERFFTAYDLQDTVEVEVYQGEDPRPASNIEIGRFRIEGLARVPAGNEVLLRMALGIDGILEVSAIEKRTGLERTVTIANAMAAFDGDELARARRQLGERWAGAPDDAAPDDASEDGASDGAAADATAAKGVAAAQGGAAGDVLRRGREALVGLEAGDREELAELLEILEAAAAREDHGAVRELTADIDDLLYYATSR